MMKYENLSSQGVSAVKRIMVRRNHILVRRNGILVPTNTFNLHLGNTLFHNRLRQDT